MKIRILALLFVVLLMGVGVGSAAIPTDYQYYFDFEEGTGTTANNANVSNLDLTLLNPNWTAYPGAVYFDGGSGDYATMVDDPTNSISGNDEFTIAIDCNPNGDAGAVFLQKTSSYQLRLLNDKISFLYYDASTSASTTLQSSVAVNTSTNHTSVIIGDGSTVYLYVDGVLEDSGTYPTNGLKDVTNSVFMAGTSVTPDELAIYDYWMYDYAVPNASVFKEADPVDPGEDPEWTGYGLLQRYALRNVLEIKNGPVNFTYLYNNTVESDGITPVDMSDFFTFSDNNITIHDLYQIKSGISSGELYINGYDNIVINWTPNATQISGGYTEFSLLDGIYNFSNVNIYSVGTYNWTTTGTSIGTDTNMTNTVIKNTHYFSLYSVPEYFVVNNVRFQDGISSLSILGSPHVTGGYIANYSVYNQYGGQLTITNFTNYEIRDVRTDRFYEPDDSWTGFLIQGVNGEARYGLDSGGYNITCNNITLNGTGRSGFDITALAYDIYAEDIEVNLSGHNGIDLHGSWNVIMRDVVIRDSSAENFMITTGSTGDAAATGVHNKTGAVDERAITTCSHDIWAYNVSSYRPAGSAFSVNRFVNAYFENTYGEDHGTMWLANILENLTVINSTSVNASQYTMVLGATDVGIYGWANDTKFIDCEFGIDNKPSYLVWSLNTSFINVNETTYNLYSPKPNDMAVYWYPNIRVVNLDGQSVSGAEITINTTAKDGYGNVITSAKTDSNGKLYDSGNRSNWIAIPDYYRDNSGTTQIYTTLIATKDGETDSELAINPDSSWYSSDLENLNGTEYVLVLDVEGSGEAEFIITDFSPSDLTQSITEGTSQTFEITVNNESQINWYINTVLTEAAGSGLLTDTFSYGIGQDAGEYNVTVTANDGVDEVSKTWTLTVEEESTPVTPDDTQSSYISSIYKNIVLAIVLIALSSVALAGKAIIDGDFNEDTFKFIGSVAVACVLVLMVVSIIINSI